MFFTVNVDLKLDFLKQTAKENNQIRALATNEKEPLLTAMTKTLIKLHLTQFLRAK